MKESEYLTPELWKYFNIKHFDINRPYIVYDVMLKMWNEIKKLNNEIEKLQEDRQITIFDYKDVK